MGIFFWHPRYISYHRRQGWRQSCNKLVDAWWWKGRGESRIHSPNVAGLDNWVHSCHHLRKEIQEVICVGGRDNQFNTQVEFKMLLRHANEISCVCLTRLESGNQLRMWARARARDWASFNTQVVAVTGFSEIFQSEGAEEKWTGPRTKKSHWQGVVKAAGENRGVWCQNWSNTSLTQSWSRMFLAYAQPHNKDNVGKHSQSKLVHT